MAEPTRLTGLEFLLEEEPRSPWVQRTIFRIRGNVSRHRHHARMWWQRHTKPYTWEEVYELDRWLCQALGTRLRAMAEGTVSYPGCGVYSPDQGGYEAWVADLRTHADALMAYLTPSAGVVAAEDRAPTVLRAQEAIAWVGAWLPSLWD